MDRNGSMVLALFLFAASNVAFGLTTDSYFELYGAVASLPWGRFAYAARTVIGVIAFYAGVVLWIDALTDYLAERER